MLAVSRRVLSVGARKMHGLKTGAVQAFDTSSMMLNGVVDTAATITSYSAAAASGISKSAMAFGLAAGGVGTAAIYSSEDDKTATIPVGTISGNAKSSCCFVPGSISDAVEMGGSFLENWQKKTGEEICFVNSNMPITDYPAQSFGLEAAKRRNALVERAVSDFIEKNQNDVVEIFAHSAGTKTALSAVRKYMEAPGKDKKEVKVYIMGAGSPESGLDKDYEALVRRGVKVTEIRDESDFVPSIAGTGGVDYVRVDTDKSKERLERIAEICGPDFIDEEYDIVTKRFLKGLSMMVEAHYIDNYIPTLLKRVEKDRVLGKAKKICKSAFSKAKSRRSSATGRNLRKASLKL